MTTMRWRWKRYGTHIQVRVFTSEHPADTRPDATFAKSGVLTFRESEWWDVQALLSPQVQIVADESVDT